MYDEPLAPHFTLTRYMSHEYFNRHYYRPNIHLTYQTTVSLSISWWFRVDLDWLAGYHWICNWVLYIPMASHIPRLHVSNTGAAREHALSIGICNRGTSGHAVWYPEPDRQTQSCLAKEISQFLQAIVAFQNFFRATAGWLITSMPLTFNNIHLRRWLYPLVTKVLVIHRRD